jgi:radical SAM superfamily enzyme YgiQ (UPF0313 family)
MREFGEVLLISCYELGHQPLGLASPIGFLERAGYAPDAIDLAVERLDPERVRRARFVGISVPMHTALRLGVRAAAAVRSQRPDAHICFFGLYAPLNRDHLLSVGADSVIGGEYEAELVRLVRSLEANNPIDPAPRPLERLDFAAPARAALPPLARYARVIRADGREELAGYTEASRGCRHRCRHCPIPPVYNGRFFVVPLAVVLEDIARQVAAGATHVTLGDPDFLNGPGHGLAVARALHAAWPALTFDLTAKIEHLLAHAETLPELGRLGCLFITSALESVDDRVLAILDKGHTRADAACALAAVRAAGITLRPSLVPFTPWTTLEGYLDLLDFLVEHDLESAIDPVQLAIRLLLPPGSLLLDHPATRPHLGPLDAAAFSHTWAHPDPRMDRLQQTIYTLVERAAAEEADPTATFDQIQALARAAAGFSPSKSPPRARRRLPRLSEPWFC